MRRPLLFQDFNEACEPKQYNIYKVIITHKVKFFHVTVIFGDIVGFLHLESNVSLGSPIIMG